MKRHARLGALQLAIMRRLWERGEMTVSDMHEALRTERGLAPTTVATMLRKMEARGIVAHRTTPEGRQFIYRATINEGDVNRSMVTELTDLLFGGDPAALVSHLLHDRGLDAVELARLKRLIADIERRMEGGRDAR